MNVDISSLKIRALFLSDFHLGFRLANASAALSMLQRINAPLEFSKEIASARKENPLAELDKILVKLESR